MGSIRLRSGLKTQPGAVCAVAVGSRGAAQGCAPASPGVSSSPARASGASVQARALGHR